MFCFKARFLSKHFRLNFLRKLQLSCFYFCAIFLRSRDQTKKTLTVTLFFSAQFSPSSRGWQFNMIILFFFIGFFRHDAVSILKFSQASASFSLQTNLPWDQTSKPYRGRVSCYMLIKYEEELYIFLISRGVPEYKYAKYYLMQH